MVVVEAKADQLGHDGARVDTFCALIVLGKLLSPSRLFKQFNPKLIVDGELFNKEIENNIKDSIRIKMECT
jgi:hypothetical protein